MRWPEVRMERAPQVWVLSEKSLEWRASELAVEGLTLEGCAHVDSRQSTQRKRPAKATRISGETNADSGGLLHCSLRHVVGFTTDEEALRRLLMASQADAAIVMADVDEHAIDLQVCCHHKTCHLHNTIVE